MPTRRDHYEYQPELIHTFFWSGCPEAPLGSRRATIFCYLHIYNDGPFYDCVCCLPDCADIYMFLAVRSQFRDLLQNTIFILIFDTISQVLMLLSFVFSCTQHC